MAALTNICEDTVENQLSSIIFRQLFIANNCWWPKDFFHRWTQPWLDGITWSPIVTSKLKQPTNGGVFEHSHFTFQWILKLNFSCSLTECLNLHCETVGFTRAINVVPRILSFKPPSLSPPSRNQVEELMASGELPVLLFPIFLESTIKTY